MQGQASLFFANSPRLAAIPPQNPLECSANLAAPYCRTPALVRLCPRSSPENPFDSLIACIDDQGVVSQNEDSLIVVVPPLYYQTIWFRVLAGCAALICLAALYRKRIRALQERSRLVHAERDRIARDLHDHLGQGLGAIGYLSDAIAMSEDALPARTHDLLGKLRRVVEQTNHGVNDLIWNLRQVGVPHSLDVALQPVAERARDMGVTVRLDIPKGLRASSLHIHEIPFVVQEAITNAYKHGRSTSVVVSAEQNQRMLEIRVADDGTGMKLEQSAAGRGGFGVMGMHERARRMHGDVTFEKNEAAGQGTVVVLRVPVDREAT